MFDLSSLNYVAIVVAIVATYALGALWYSPIGFGKMWMDELGKTQEQLGSPVKPMLVSFATGALTVVSMALLMSLVPEPNWSRGLCIGGLVGVGFIATAMASDYAFCGYSMRFYLIQTGYRVVYALIMGVILGAWQ